ncbi:MAG: GatB/YqeY domain-containing protein [Candidatus Dojkabacteria bacterium]|jgi:uncharacterized protein YqeY
MSLVETLRKDMFEATKKAQKDKVDILKMALASIKNEEVRVGKELSDDEALKVVRKETSKIKDAIEQYEKIDRPDLLNREKSQLAVLEEYLPKLMSEEEIKKFVSKKIEELNASSPRDFGRVIGAVMQELNGSADGSVVKDIVESLLEVE